MQKLQFETTIRTKFDGVVQGGMGKKLGCFDPDQPIGGAITTD